MNLIIRWFYSIYTFLKFTDDATQKARYAKCLECEHKRLGFCDICKCVLKAKTRVRHQKCPVGKW